MRAMALAMVRAAAAVLVVRTAVLIDARMRLLERRVSTVVMVRAAAAMVRAAAAEAMVRAAAVIGDPPLERPQLANRRPSTRTAIGPVPVAYVGPFWSNFPGQGFHACLVWVSRSRSRSFAIPARHQPPVPWRHIEEGANWAMQPLQWGGEVRGD